MTQSSLEKMQKVAERRGFTNFWEAFRYMSDAGFSELEALKVGLELFNGKMWDGIIDAAWKSCSSNVVTWSTGSTMNYNLVVTGVTLFGSIDPANSDPDDLLVEIFIMTKDAKPSYLPLYKSYIETRYYAELPELEAHIKSITFKLTTELAIHLFKEGCKILN